MFSKMFGGSASLHTLMAKPYQIIFINPKLISARYLNKHYNNAIFSYLLSILQVLYQLTTEYLFFLGTKIVIN